MRSTDEQLREIISRADRVKDTRRLKKAVLGDAAASCVFLALLSTVAAYLPHLPDSQAGSTVSRYGSLLLASPFIGYVIVGLLAFALGVCVTLLCRHRKEWKDREQK